MYDAEVWRWNCQYSFQEIVDILLAPRDNTLTLTPSMFMWPKENGRNQVKTQMSPSATVHLESYKNMKPLKQYYDLSSNPEHRCRTETTDGALMTLTTNTRIWLSGLDIIMFIFIFFYLKDIKMKDP